MTNPPDPKTKTPRTTEALAKLNRWKARSDAATMRGSHLDSDDPKPPDGWEFASTLELENQSLTRRLEEVEKERDELRSGIKNRDEIISDFDGALKETEEARERFLKEAGDALAKLTALRTVAEGAQDALECIANQSDKTATGMRSCAKAALAALRAELDQADSNASNSPTASRESQG